MSVARALPFDPDGFVIIENALHEALGYIEMLRELIEHATTCVYGSDDVFRSCEMTVRPAACAGFHPADGICAGEPVIERIGFAMTELVHKGVLALNMRQLLVQTDIISVPDAERAGFTPRKVKVRDFYMPLLGIIKHLPFVSENRKYGDQFELYPFNDLFLN